jgi:HEAT repeat protein
MASKRWTVPTLLLTGLLLAAPAWTGFSSVYAQDSDTVFAEAVDLYQRGRDSEALEKLKEVLAMDPGQEEAYRLREAVEYNFWLDLMVKGGEHELIAKRILELARPEERRRVDDGEAIRSYVQQLASDDFAVRTRARMRLAADHGSYAVPYLLEALQGAAESEYRIELLYTLTQMGSQVTWPLVEVLRSTDADLRRNAIVVLGNVHDDRAVPELLRHLEAGTLDAGEAELISEAVEKCGGSVAAAARDELLDLAVAYAHKDPEVVREVTSTNPVWSWTGEGLTKVDAPPYLYNLLIAEKLAYDALQVAPGDTGVMAVLANVLLLQKAAVDTAVAAGDESASALEPRVTRAVNLAHSTGAIVLDDALSMALAHEHHEMAVSAIEALASVDAATGVPGDSPLFEALDSADKRVRYAAAIAIASRLPDPGSMSTDLVVHTLIQAVGEESVRSVLVIDDHDDARNSVLSMAREAGMWAVGAASGVSGLARAKEMPGADLFVLRAGLRDVTVDRMLADLAADYRTQGVPVVLLAGEDEVTEVENAYGSRVAAVVATPPDAAAADRLASALEEDTNRNRQLALEVAGKAATALYLMAHSDLGYSLDAAVPSLIGTLERQDSVRRPAILALGFIGHESAVDPLVEVFANTGNAADIRAAAAIAAGRISAKVGVLSQEAYDRLSEGMADDEPSVAAAAARGLGLAAVGAEDRTRVLEAHRPPLQAAEPND